MPKIMHQSGQTVTDGFIENGAETESAFHTGV